MMLEVKKRFRLKSTPTDRKIPKLDNETGVVKKFIVKYPCLFSQPRTLKQKANIYRP